MPAINKIHITGFKAFPNDFELELEGKHLLMYGENGSGKSSIYYALHCIFQAPFKSDAGKKYFDIESEQHLKNIYNLEADSKIWIDFEGHHPFIYQIDKHGYNTTLIDGTHPLPANINGCFINHQFLFHFFNFRNSQNINLFPVFIKDILSFCKDEKTGLHIGEMYDDITSSIIKKGKRIDPVYISNIDFFNNSVKNIVENINIYASDIYNKYFRDNEDLELQIRLRYDSNLDKPAEDPNEYWLKYDRIIEYTKENGILKEHVSSYKKLNEPFIGLEISELQPNGSFRKITKPHTYFNEAKLTAIALSVRFALLNLDKPADGRFLALDDMLISLDMSNRTKVVNFLLEISDKYKVYLFTHDRAFFNYICHEIQQKGKSDEWVYKRLSYSHKDKMPLIFDEYSDSLSKAKHFYDIGDYDTSAIYMRKQLEQSIGGLLPYELKTRADGGFLDLQTLWDKMVKFYSNNGKSLAPSMQKLFNDSKLLILNVAAHYQRLSNPIYKIELEQVFKLVDYINSLEKISNKLVIESGKQIIFHHPTVNYQCSFELDSDLEIIQDEHIVARIPKCKNIKWSYNNIENWDFEKNSQNNAHVLLKASPNLMKFFEGCCQKLPLGITHDMLMHNCKIDNRTPLIEFFGKIDLLKIAVKVKK